MLLPVSVELSEGLDSGDLGQNRENRARIDSILIKG
jgi:hypothetical protein